MMEAGVVIGTEGNALHWHLPPGRTGGALPDSRDLWDVMWAAFKEGQLDGFAHSHPGSGVPGPSMTDITTFVAIEKALGKNLNWWIISSDAVILLRAETPGHPPFYQRLIAKDPSVVVPRLSWLDELRRLSY